MYPLALLVARLKRVNERMSKRVDERMLDAQRGGASGIANKSLCVCRKIVEYQAMKKSIRAWPYKTGKIMFCETVNWKCQLK